MRIDRRPAEHLVDAVDQPVGHGVLEVLGFVVHFGPAHAHHLDQEQLDQPVPPQDQRGELLARPGQPDAGIGLVAHQPRLRERLDHRRRGAGHDAQRGRQLAHRDQRVGRGSGALGLKMAFR